MCSLRQINNFFEFSEAVGKLNNVVRVFIFVFVYKLGVITVPIQAIEYKLVGAFLRQEFLNSRSLPGSSDFLNFIKLN